MKFGHLVHTSTWKGVERSLFTLVRSHDILGDTSVIETPGGTQTYRHKNVKFSTGHLTCLLKANIIKLVCPQTLLLLRFSINKVRGSWSSPVGEDRKSIISCLWRTEVNF